MRKSFRDSENKKKILYGFFIKGQKTKKKVTTEEAVAEIRKKLSVDQFVKPKQVKHYSLNCQVSIRYYSFSMKKKTMKKVEIMTAMMKELGNFATQLYEKRQSV